MEVAFEYIFNPKRSNQLIFNNTSPYQYPTSTLLASDSKWSSVPVTDPATGPSIWSVKSHSHFISLENLWKICLQIFLGPVRHFSLCVLFSGGRVSAFLTLAMSLSTEHLVLLGTPGRLQLWNITELEDDGFLVSSCLILLKSLVVNLHLFFSASSFYFSESVKSLFWPILPEEKKLPNNYAHLDIGCWPPKARPSSLHRYTSPAMLKSIKHSSLYSLELEHMHKNDDMVKILTCLIIVHTV